MNILYNIINRLKYLTDIVPEKIMSIPDNEMSRKTGNENWSKKEILGHLIDSAANNHQRIIRVQYEKTPYTFLYEQNKWNQLQMYNSEDTRNLVRLWEGYNKHLAHILSVLNKESLAIEFKLGEKDVNLLILIQDYIDHLEHHLKQITGEI